MRTPARKSLSLLVVLVTSLGLLLSLFFLIQIWRLRQPATVKLESGIEQTSAFLETTRAGIDVIDQVVGTVYTSTLYLDDTTNALARTIQGTNSFIESAGTFMGEDLINTITNTQKTLDTAKSSALVIDNIMSALSRVPLIGINYNPSLPLSTALGKVSESLDPFQGSLKSFKTDLETTGKNMQAFNEQLLILDQNIKTINKNLDSSRNVIDNYRTQVITLQSWMDQAKASLPTWMNTACWVLTVIILWLMLIQIAILIQAANQIGATRAISETTPEN